MVECVWDAPGVLTVLKCLGQHCRQPCFPPPSPRFIPFGVKCPYLATTLSPCGALHPRPHGYGSFIRDLPN